MANMRPAGDYVPPSRAPAVSGGNPPMRPDQRLAVPTSRSGTGPAPQTGIFIGKLVIIYGTGTNTGFFFYSGTPAKGNPPILAVTLADQDPYGNTVTPSAITDSGMPILVYSGTPAHGNLIVSIAPAAGTDEFSNSYPEGVSFSQGAIPGGLINAASIPASAVGFTATSIGGITTYVQGTAPSGSINAGSLWIDTSSGNALYQYESGTWSLYQFGSGSIEANSISAAQMVANTITASQLAAGIVYAGIVNGTLIEGAQFVAYGSTGEILIYSGPPAAGNLIGSWSANSGSDSFGNTYLGGIYSYDPTNDLYTGLFSGSLDLGSQNPSTLIDVAAAITLDDALSASTAPAMTVQSPAAVSSATSTSKIVLLGESQNGSKLPQVVVFIGSSVTPVTTALLEVQGELAVTTGGASITGGTTSDTLTVTGTSDLEGAVTATGGTQAAPTLIETDTWHNITLAATWTAATPTPQYRLGPDGLIQIKGAIIFTSTGAGLSGNNAFTAAGAIPSAYQPASVQYFPAVLIGGSGAPTITANKTPVISLSAGGQLTLLNVSSTGAAGDTVTFSFGGTVTYQVAN
jgi:hypothetical protein